MKVLLSSKSQNTQNRTLSRMDRQIDRPSQQLFCLSSFVLGYLPFFRFTYRPSYRLSSFVFHVHQTTEKDLVLLVVLYVVLCANLSVVFMFFSYIFHRHSSFTVIFQTKLKKSKLGHFRTRKFLYQDIFVLGNYCIRRFLYQEIFDQEIFVLVP